MSIFAGHIFRIICCTVACSVVMAVLHDGITKSVVRMAAGILLTITILSPLQDIEIPAVADIGEEYIQEGNTAASQGEAYLKKSCTEIISAELQEYILDKAQMLGCNVQASVALDEEGCPDYIIISGAVSPDVRKKLEDILIHDFGITREDFRWTGSAIPLP